MRLTFIILFVSLYFLNAKAEIHNWPPDSIEHSPLQRKLTDNRFVPSTKRWNLVWADQLVPNWITPAKVEFASKNYVGTQKIWSDQISQFRKYNKNFIGLIYHLAVGINPNHNDDCPNPKSNSGDGFIGVVSPKGYVSEWTEHFEPWLIEQDIALNSSRFEAMFQHYDESDKNHRVWHNDPYWLMNIENDDWTEYISEQCKKWMIGNENEGCFFDVSVETNSSLYNPKSQNPPPSNFNWWQAPHKPFDKPNFINDYNEFSPWINNLYLKYYQQIYKTFHNDERDFLVIPNTDQMVTTVYDPVWLDGNQNGETIDGAMIEGFGNYKGYDMWLTLERCVRHITGRSKILIAQFDADTPEERYRRTAMYMLVKNENSFININPRIVAWYPEYEIDLGDQSPLPKTLDSLRVKGNGWQSLWKREYQHGIVFCNTSDSYMEVYSDDIPTFSINYWQMVVTSGGGEVNENGEIQKQSLSYEGIQISSKILIPPSECIIIHTTPWTSVNENKKSNKDFSISPNPANDILNININYSTISSFDISIYNNFGEKVLSLKLKNNTNQIDITKLPSGSYFIVLHDGSDLYYQRLSILK